MVIQYGQDYPVTVRFLTTRNIDEMARQFEKILAGNLFTLVLAGSRNGWVPRVYTNMRLGDGGFSVKKGPKGQKSRLEFLCTSEHHQYLASFEVEHEREDLVAFNPGASFEDRLITVSRFVFSRDAQGKTGDPEIIIFALQ